MQLAKFTTVRIGAWELQAGTGMELMEMVDLVDRRRLPLRVPVGLRTERLFARLSPSVLGRLVRSPYKW